MTWFYKSISICRSCSSSALLEFFLSKILSIKKGQYLLLDDVSDSVVVLSYRTDVWVCGMWLCLRKISLTYSILSWEYFGILIRLTAGSARMSSHLSISWLFFSKFPYFSATTVSSLLDLILNIFIKLIQDITRSWPYSDDSWILTIFAIRRTRFGWSRRRLWSRSCPPEIIFRRRIRIDSAVEEFETTRDTPVCSIIETICLVEWKFLA